MQFTAIKDAQESAQLMHFITKVIKYNNTRVFFSYPTLQKNSFITSFLRVVICLSGGTIMAVGDWSVVCKLSQIENSMGKKISKELMKWLLWNLWNIEDGDGLGGACSSWLNPTNGSRVWNSWDSGMGNGSVEHDGKVSSCVE